MTTPFLDGDLAADEGLRLRAYPDPESPRAKAMLLPEPQRPAGWQFLSGEPWTCGYGCVAPDVKEGTVWTLAEARARLKAKRAEAVADLDRNIPWWRQLSDVRQDCLANMAFNLGWPRLSGFKHMLEALDRGDYAKAADEMLASRWAIQVKGRAQRLATQMRTGVRA